MLDKRGMVWRGLILPQTGECRAEHPFCRNRGSKGLGRHGDGGRMGRQRKTPHLAP